MPRDLSKLMPPDLVNSQCTECGAEVPAEFGSCDALFTSILAPLGLRGVETLEAAALGRLLVDTFAMQHPRRSCKSVKSYAAHLTGLCCGVEYNGATSVYAALQRWLSRSAEAIGIGRPTEPDYRGALTIRYVYDAQTGDPLTGALRTSEKEATARVHAWAREVWEAYASQHELTRSWIKEAMGE